jgi:hypothetical protein
MKPALTILLDSDNLLLKTKAFILNQLLNPFINFITYPTTPIQLHNTHPDAITSERMRDIEERLNRLETGGRRDFTIRDDKRRIQEP